MATYQSDYRVKYHDEFQVRWSTEQTKAASEMAGRKAATAGVVGASYGGIIGADADVDRRA